MQESVAVLLVEVVVFTNPGAHGLHSGWVVVVPATAVYSPGEHLVCASHRSEPVQTVG